MKVLAEDSIALGIAALALFISFVSLYLSQLRGPSIKPIELEGSKRSVLITESRYPNIDSLPFTVAVSVVNSGGTAGIVAKPSIAITPVDSLRQAAMQIAIRQISIEPSNKSPDQGYGVSSAPVYSIPPYSVNVIKLECYLALTDFQRVPPIQHFTRECNLKEVHFSHFNSRKEQMQVLISELQRTDTLGYLKVTIDCSEKTLPIFGSMGYKSKEFLSNAPLKYDTSLVKQLSENSKKLEFDKEYAVNNYLNLLHYIQQQSPLIIKMLEVLDAESAAAYPTEHLDEQQVLARLILSIKDEKFGRSLDELDRHIQTYKDILKTLREKKLVELTENDKLNIRNLKEAMENALNQSLHLRAVILEEFK
jgi:hypothetical protein